MTKQVKAGSALIGGGAKITVQSMTNTSTRDAKATLRQIHALTQAGCEIVRVSVYDELCAANVRELVDNSTVPLVADIHFDHKLAIKSIENGVAKVRINPGNIGGEANVRNLADCLKTHKIPVRIGVNSGSVEKDILRKNGGVTAKGMVESALTHAKMLEKCGFLDIVLSLKATNVRMTVDAYRLAARQCDYPLHLGITEAGGNDALGIAKSSIGIGSLLLDGIGDTIRVSLTGDPVPEVMAGMTILRAIGLRRDFVNVISCPTCGRTCVDVIGIAEEVKRRTVHIREPLDVAVMGCVVNGPGEAREADLGIAGGKDGCALFRKNSPPMKITGNAADVLMEEIQKVLAERHAGATE